MPYHSALVFAVSAVVGFAQADVLSVADIKARNGVLLSADDLQNVMPGAKVVTHAPNGDNRVWRNNLNGRLVASTDARGGSNAGGQRLRSGEGSWRIDNGAYCVDMQWPRVEERWCRYIYRIGNKYYGVRVHAEDNAHAMEFILSK